MPAWKHFNKWDDGFYRGYRKHVEKRAPDLEKRKEDCADLSMLLLIEFAADNGLPVTLRDNDDVAYASQKSDAVYYRGGLLGRLWSLHGVVSWKKPEEFYAAVKQRIGAEALFKENTTPNHGPPAAGDLMLTKSHCALVYRVYPPGEYHPEWTNLKIPVFPGGDAATAQFEVTKYFKGSVFPPNRQSGHLAGTTMHRIADKDFHFDYLNSRSKHKRNAELIYFANARQAVQEDGFVFCKYASHVLAS